eukprot:3642757-Rhodomonas_salina.2
MSFIEDIGSDDDEWLDVDNEGSDIKDIESTFNAKLVTQLEKRDIATVLVQDPQDLKTLENIVRRCLHCDYGACAALDGSEYVAFRLKALRRLKGRLQETGEFLVRLAQSLVLVGDYASMRTTIREQPTLLQMYPREKGAQQPKKKKQKTKANVSDEE